MMCLIGLGLPGPILLVVPHDFPHFDKERYARTTRKVIARMNQELASHEQIKGVLMIKEPWSIENGVLTPTLKINVMYWNKNTTSLATTGRKMN